MSKSTKVSTIIAAILLISVGLFHASGLSWLTSEIVESNASDMMKSVFPVLFIHVSIQCIGLALLCLLSLKFTETHKLVSYFVGGMVTINAGLGLWLSAFPPAVVLIIIASLNFYSASKSPNALL